MGAEVGMQRGPIILRVWIPSSKGPCSKRQCVTAECKRLDGWPNFSSEILQLSLADPGVINAGAFARRHRWVFVFEPRAV